MDVYKLVEIVAKLGPSIWQRWKKAQKKTEIREFFEEKYSFTKKVEIRGSLSYGMSTETTFSEGFIDSVLTPFITILKSDKITDSVRESAGEIYLLAFAYDEFLCSGIYKTLRAIETDKDLYKDF